MRLLEFVSFDGDICYVNIDDISCIIATEAEEYKATIYLKSDNENCLITRYKPEIVILGNTIIV